MTDQPAPVPASPEVAATAEAAGDEPFRYAPRLAREPDPETGALVVEVDVPDGPDGRPSDDDLIAAMSEAARLLFPGSFVEETP